MSVSGSAGRAHSLAWLKPDCWGDCQGKTKSDRIVARKGFTKHPGGTAILLIKGGPAVGANLSLLSNYIVGFRVSWTGALIGMVETGLLGFGFGWVMAKLINAVVGWQERSLIQRLERRLVFDVLDEEVHE